MSMGNVGVNLQKTPGKVDNYESSGLPCFIRKALKDIYIRGQRYFTSQVTWSA